MASRSSAFSICMSINFAVPSKFWVHQIIKFGRNYSNQSPLPSCSILLTQENASAKATKFYTQMPPSPYSSDICTSTCDGSTWNLNLGSVFDLDKCGFRHCAEKGQKLKRKIYHPVNRLRSFLSLGHSVTRSLGFQYCE